jgi:hypothetical protein
MQLWERAFKGEFELYRDEERGIEMVYPQGWEIEEKEDETKFKTIFKGLEGWISLWIYKQPMSLEEMISREKSAIMKFPRAQITAESSRTVANLPAYWIEWSSVKDDKEIKAKNFLVAGEMGGENKAVAIRFYVFADFITKHYDIYGYNILEAISENCVQSFNFSQRFRILDIS